MHIKTGKRRYILMHIKTGKCRYIVMHIKTGKRRYILMHIKTGKCRYIVMHIKTGKNNKENSYYGVFSYNKYVLVVGHQLFWRNLTSFIRKVEEVKIINGLVGVCPPYCKLSLVK
jgi:hypothetical protein